MAHFSPAGRFIAMAGPDGLLSIRKVSGGLEGLPYDGCPENCRTRRGGFSSLPPCAMTAPYDGLWTGKGRV